MREQDDLNSFLRSRSHFLHGTDAVRMLHTASDEAQQLRRVLLRGASILIVGGGPKSKSRFYNILASLGVDLYLMDCPNSIWPAIVEKSTSPFRAFFPVNLSDLPSMQFNAIKVVKATLGAALCFDAVFTFFELYVQHAAHVNRVLSNGRDYIAFAECARSKAATRAALVAKGIPSPKYYKISALSDIPRACAHVGFPAVLKPLSGVFSIGVVNVHTEREVFMNAQQLITQGDASHNDDENSCEIDELVSKCGDKALILEEFLDGPEFDVDILFDNGDAVYAQVTDNWGFEPPWCQDCGLQGPSRFPAGKQQELLDMAIRCAKATGAVDGVIHAELRYTSEGARLIEVNARMGGAAIFDVHQRVWDVNLVENHCMVMCGIPIRPVIRKTPLCHLSCIILYAPYSGEVTSEKWLDFLREDRRIFNVVYEQEKGAVVNGPEDSSPDWIGQIYVTGKKIEEVDELVKDIVTWKAPVPIKAKEAGRERGYFFPGDQFPFVDTKC